MNRSLAMACCIVLLAVAAVSAAPVNGYLHEVDGQEVLHVWGTHYEMGYAYGYLKGDAVVELMHSYILQLLPPALYELVHDIVPFLFTMPAPYHEEAQGLIDGARDAGAALFIEPLGREFGVNDLLLANAVGDIGAMACSSQIAWDQATESDARLNGETAVVRNLDWMLAGPDRFALTEATIVVVFSPSDPGAPAVASVAFPGYLGCLSCMNANGTTAVVNIAHNGIPLWENSFTPWFVPVGFTLREALHAPDSDLDSAARLDAVAHHVARRRASGAVVVNLAVPNDLPGSDPGVIVEVDDAGAIRRYPADDPALPDNVLLATNDLRKLRHHEQCERYDDMVCEIAARDGLLTLDDMWEIEGVVVQDWFLTTTAQTLYFLPAQREIGVSYTDGAVYSPFKEPAVLSWEDIAALPEGVELDDDEPDDSADDEDDREEGCGL